MWKYEWMYKSAWILSSAADLSEPDAAAGRTDYDTGMGIWNEGFTVTGISP